jgi:mannose-6-phosphate isomerase-like protein (cupin superfamily)
MRIVSPADEEEWREGVRTRMLVSAWTGATALCLFEQWMAPGTGAPPHCHAVEEVLTVVEGEAEVWIEEERALARRGQSLVVPAGRRHGFRNVGPGTLHVRAVLASAVFEASYDGAAEPVRRWLPPPEA